jgi:chromate reductase
MTDGIQVLAICGSLRKASFNRMAMAAAIERAPAGMHVTEGVIEDIPLYNEDLRVAGDPAAIARLKQQVQAADALLFVTPEYNYSVPGVLKNAIDWVSRPPDQSPFDGKPVAILGASAGVMGTVRSQQHLRQTLMSLNMLPVNTPEVLIGQAAKRFDDQGRLTEEVTGKYIAQLMQALLDWTLRLKS